MFWTNVKLSIRKKTSLHSMIAAENRCFQQIPRHPFSGKFCGQLIIRFKSRSFSGTPEANLWVIPSLKTEKPWARFPQMLIEEHNSLCLFQHGSFQMVWCADFRTRFLQKCEIQLFLLKPSFQEFEKSDLYTLLEFQFLCRRLKAFPNVNDETKNIHGQSDHHATQAFNSCSFKSTFSMPPKKTKLCL